MSQASGEHLGLETIEDVTVVTFLDPKLVGDAEIQDVGDKLYSLVEDEGHRNLLLDFSHVQYMSSSMLGKLTTLQKKVNAVKGKLKFCNIHPDIYVVFKITQLHKKFDIHDDLPSALDAF